MEDIQRIERIVRQHGGHLAEHPLFCGMEVENWHGKRLFLDLYISERTLATVKKWPAQMEDWYALAEGVDWDAALTRIAHETGLASSVQQVSRYVATPNRSWALCIYWDMPEAEEPVRSAPPLEAAE